MSKDLGWVQEFFKEHGVYPIAGGDGTGDQGAQGAQGAQGGGTGGVQGEGGYNPNKGAADAAAAAAAAAAGAQGAQGSAFKIPDEYKDKPYLKDVKDLNSLLKMLDGAQSKLGQRPAGMPQDSAPQAEWDKWYASIRPEKAEMYEFKRDEAVAKALGTTPEIETKVKGIFHKWGITKAQAVGLQQDYEALQMDLGKEHLAKAQAEDEAFQKLGETSFGKDADSVMKQGKILLERLTPANMKPFLPKLSSEALVVLAGVLKSVKDKYIAEDIIPDGDNNGAGALTEAEISAKAREIMARPEYSNGTLPGHDAAVQAVKELYAKLK